MHCSPTRKGYRYCLLNSWITAVFVWNQKNVAAKSLGFFSELFKNDWKVQFKVPVTPFLRKKRLGFSEQLWKNFWIWSNTLGVMDSWNLENRHKFAHDRVLGGMGLVILCDVKSRTRMLLPQYHIFSHVLLLTSQATPNE